MSETLGNATGQLSLAGLRRVDQVCDAFEAAWQRGERPRIEESLKQAPGARQSTLLRHLLVVELEYRLAAGDRLTAREYMDRFPEHAQVIDPLFRESRATTRVAHDLGMDTPGSEASPDRPESLGRFRVVDLLGQGGFGSVYRAYDPQLDRTVAVKLPHARQFTADERQRFLREARSAARLKHPGIVPVHEIGHEDGVPYIVSEWIDGSTLDEWCRTAQPTFREAAELVARIADALDYAHRRSVIHRDVKPGNILVDDSGRPHLTDFGLARRDGTDVTLTLEGQIVGTPAYMAPEQASGSLRKIDARADLYSLGVVLYELLTGELPFGGDAPTILHQAVHARPRPPRRVNRQIPRRLERIVLKCLAKEPDRRYATAAELADDLRGWLDGQATPPRPGQGSRRAGHWRRRLLPFAGLATAVGTALLLVPVVTPVALWGTTRGEELSQPPSQSLASAEQIDDFEGHLGAWAAFHDGPTDTLLTVERDSAIRHGGDSSLAIGYDVGPGDWATCSLVHERPQDWSSFQGLCLYLHAERVGQPVVIVAYGGTSPENLIHFEYSLKTGPAAVAGWQRVDVPWRELITPQWEGDRRLAFNPRESMGMAFAFDGPGRGRHAGRIWVDDVTLLRSERQAGDGLAPPPARAAISAPLPPKG